jgi:hypothetical protein
VGAVMLDAVIATGVLCATQPVLLVTVTEYKPAWVVANVCAVEPLFHK